MVEVTQEDREAAAKVAKMQSRYAKAANMKLGNCDTSPLVQLMARHRTTTLAAKEAELAAERAKIEKLRAFVADVAGQWLPHEPEPFDDFDPCLEDGYRIIVERARATLAETQP